MYRDIRKNFLHFLKIFLFFLVFEKTEMVFALGVIGKD